MFFNKRLKKLIFFDFSTISIKFCMEHPKKVGYRITHLGLYLSFDVLIVITIYLLNRKCLIYRYGGGVRGFELPYYR